MDHPQKFDNKFNELPQSGSKLKAVTKKTQLTKIMSSLYAKCINTVNQQAQGEATARAFNNLILSMSTSITTGLLEAINMDAVK